MQKGEIQVKELDPKMYKEYREFKLARLKEDPQSSHVTYNEEAGLAIELWKKDLEMSLEKDKFVHMFAVEGKKILGMGTIFFSNKTNTKHVGNLVSIHVDKSKRKMGIGQKIIEALLKEARLKKLVKLELTVNTIQIPAINLYLKYGFTVVGKLQKTIFVGKEYYDEYIMEKML